MAESKTVKVMKPLAILNAFFNQGEGKVKTADFAAECRALSPEDKKEMAELAAIEMGVEVA